MKQTGTFVGDRHPLDQPGKHEIVTGPTVMLPAVHQLLSRQDTERHIFNVNVLWEMHLSLDDQILKQTVAFLLRHHDGLRLRLCETEQGWSAYIAEPDDGNIPVARVDLSIL